jgi:predicted dehydrogenase
MSLAALRAGKHAACTVPMATNIADCRKIVDLARRTGLKYMMMETVVHSREYRRLWKQEDRRVAAHRARATGLDVRRPLRA